MRSDWKLTGLLVFCIFTAGIVSCKKSKATVDPVVQWEKYKWKGGSPAGFLNCAAINNRFNVIDAYGYYKDITGIYSAVEPRKFGFDLYEDVGMLKFPVPDNYFSYTDRKKIYFRSALSYDNSSTGEFIDMTTVDPNFSDFVKTPYWQGEMYVVSKDHFVLVPYKAVKSGVSVPTPYFILIKLNPPVDKDYEFKVVSTKLLQNDLFPGEVPLTRIQTFGANFYVSMGNNTYRIDTTGNMTKIADKDLLLFEKDKQLFAFSTKLVSDKVEYLQSPDQGKTWNTIGLIPFPLLASMQYGIVDNKLIGYIKAQLFLVELTSTTFSVTELDNTGLGLADITAVALADPNTVFVCNHCNSFSLDCGGYYKPLKNFITKKQ